MTPPSVTVPDASRTRRGQRPRPGAVAVEVLVCGSTDRGDDGAPIAATASLRGRLDPDVRVRTVGQLDIDDLLGVPRGAAVVVDAATGLRRGQILVLSLDGLVAREDGLRPRSSHALEFREVIGLADMIRGRPLPGRIIAIGGGNFGLGAPLSSRVAAAIPALGDAILDTIAGLRG